MKTKPQFLTRLVAEKIDARNWKLFQPLKYRSEVLRKNGILDTIEVPANFVTDFASVPRPLWNLFPPDGSYTAAAVVHDWLYRKTTIHRAICDAVFLEAMKQCGTSLFARSIIYSTVRMWGWSARKKV